MAARTMVSRGCCLTRRQAPKHSPRANIARGRVKQKQTAYAALRFEGVPVVPLLDPGPCWAVIGALDVTSSSSSSSSSLLDLREFIMR